MEEETHVVELSSIKIVIEKFTHDFLSALDKGHRYDKIEVDLYIDIWFKEFYDQMLLIQKLKERIGLSDDGLD